MKTKNALFLLLTDGLLFLALYAEAAVPEGLLGAVTVGAVPWQKSWAKR
jgi:hypothetical protein